MRPMTLARRASMAAGLLLATAWALSPAQARAEPPPDSRQAAAIALAAPAEVPLGSAGRLVALLQDGTGKPIAGATILFTSPAALAGVVSEMTIGEALTNADGKAVLDYEVRIQGPNQVTARFVGDRVYRPADASATVVVSGQQQLVQRGLPVQLPWLGSWLLIAVVGSVWAVYFGAMLAVAGIPEPLDQQPEKGGTR